MRLIINLLLLILIAVIGYLLISSIREPIKFKAEKDRRTNAVVDKLIKIRKMQEFYRDIALDGSYAGSWEELQNRLDTGRFMRIKVTGDPDDPDFKGEILYDTSYTPAIDTVQAMGINLDSLKFVPYGEGATFEIQADTLTYQSTLVNVLEVSTNYNTFMGPFADPRFAKYDNGYDPKKTIKFGDMNRPNISGNWE